MMNATGKLTNLQLEILKLYNLELPDYQLQEIKSLLAEYFANKVSDGMDEVWKQQGWTIETIERLRNEHIRTSYKNS